MPPSCGMADSLSLTSRQATSADSHSFNSRPIYGASRSGLGLARNGSDREGGASGAFRLEDRLLDPGLNVNQGLTRGLVQDLFTKHLLQQVIQLLPPPALMTGVINRLQPIRGKHRHGFRIQALPHSGRAGPPGRSAAGMASTVVTLRTYHYEIRRSTAHPRCITKPHLGVPRRVRRTDSHRPGPPTFNLTRSMRKQYAR